MARIEYHMRSKFLSDTAIVLLYLFFISILCLCSGQDNQNDQMTICVQDDKFGYTLMDTDHTHYTECKVDCKSHCICSLNSVSTITSNCSDGNVSTTQILYPVDEVMYLRWVNSTIHRIGPATSAARFSDSLLILDLGDVGLSEIQQGAFVRLKDLKWLLLGYYQLYELHPGTFDGLISLVLLNLRGNELQVLQPDLFRVLRSLERVFLMNNRLREIRDGLFDSLKKLEIIVLSYNLLHEIQQDMFHGMLNVKILELANTSLSEIPSSTFASLYNLQLLHLAYNHLTSLHSNTFQDQINLQQLYLYDNLIWFLPKNIFENLKNLRQISLSNNYLNQLPLLSRCTSLQIIQVTSNPLRWIDKEVFAGLNKTVQLLVTNYATCCFASSVQCRSDELQSPFLTCTRMLTADFLRIVMWFMSIFGIIGNIYALYTRFKNRRRSNKVQVLFITCLSVSDFTMCIYLIILLSVDMYYTDYFPSHSESWRSSALCRFAGALSVLSSEASAFFITLISIDRFLGIKYTFGGRRLSFALARFLVTVLWIVAILFSIASFVLSGFNTNYYRVSEVCVGLPISKFKLSNSTNTYIDFDIADGELKNRFLISEDKEVSSEVSMYLSIVMFTGLNFLCFLVVGFCYTSIFISAIKTRKASGRSPTFTEEMRMAKKMSLLVLTDFCCWVPVGVLSILVQAGVVEVSPKAYVWIAAFVLPINSTLNPFLYTLSGHLFDIDKWPCCKCRHGKGEQIAMRPIHNVTLRSTVSVSATSQKTCPPCE